jgi:tRNA threonylcarbamoyladenosine biosynthesis protein TsaE
MSPILDAQTLDFVSHSDTQTRRLGERLAAFCTGGEIVCLSGDLGAGKTCFVQGLAKGLGVKETVISPTFTIIREYAGTKDRPSLYHVDLYRLCESDVASTGLEDYLEGEGIVAIEWAEHLGHLAPAECLQIEFRYLDETKRSLRFSARGKRCETLLDAYRHSLFGS